MAHPGNEGHKIAVTEEGEGAAQRPARVKFLSQLTE